MCICTFGAELGKVMEPGELRSNGTTKRARNFSPGPDFYVEWGQFKTLLKETNQLLRNHLQAHADEKKKQEEAAQLQAREHRRAISARHAAILGAAMGVVSHTGYDWLQALIARWTG
ncbi:MAG: hypothetical protein KGJ86_20405 [Chloroflexota bacterium]|nr:hypothetical protein [Chloroflexota bacterium]